MTKERIKARAKEQFPNDEFKQQIVIDAINWATKELQKQIQIDAEHIIALQKQNGELTDKVKELESELHRVSLNEQLAINNGRNFLKQIAELEAQIKKMQNCRNCKNEKIEGACGHFTQVGWCRDWELAD